LRDQRCVDSFWRKRGTSWKDDRQALATKDSTATRMRDALGEIVALAPRYVDRSALDAAGWRRSFGDPSHGRAQIRDAISKELGAPRHLVDFVGPVLLEPIELPPKLLKRRE
jgi:hypothetical protein